MFKIEFSPSASVRIALSVYMSSYEISVYQSDLFNSQMYVLQCMFT